MPCFNRCIIFLSDRIKFSTKLKHRITTKTHNENLKLEFIAQLMVNYCGLLDSTAKSSKKKTENHINISNYEQE